MFNQIKPGFFSVDVACDKMRFTFDVQNEQILKRNQVVDFVFFGDSITEMWNVNLYFSDLGFIVNRGIGGDTTHYLLKRLEADVIQLKPKNVVFLAGINDVIQSSPDLWWKKDGKDKDEVIKSITSNIENIIKLCKENNINGYFCSLLPIDLCSPYNTFGLEDMVVKINRIIKELCLNYGVAYIDYYSELISENGLNIKDGLTYDGLHPNTEGYDIMASKLRENLIK